MDTEIMNTFEEAVENTPVIMEAATKADNGFAKGVAVGIGVGAVAVGGIKLAITGIKKVVKHFKSKKYIEAELHDVPEEKNDKVNENSDKKNK